MKSLLRWLIERLPQPFRERFGRELIAQVETEYELARVRGLFRAWMVGLATATDLVWANVAERLWPSWRPPADRISPYGTGLEAWARDFRQASRSLRRAPTFSVAAVVTLGLSMGAIGAVFSVVHAVLLEPLPFEEPHRLVHVAASAPGSELPAEFTPFPEFFFQYRDGARLLEDVASYSWFTSTLRAGERVERVAMSAVSASLFPTLGVAPMLGRLPVPLEGDSVAVISHALWVDWFGADEGVIGRSYEMRGASRTIIGVMGPEFTFPNERVRLWYLDPLRAENVVPGRGSRSIVARVADGAGREDVENELFALARRLPERFGGSPEYARLIERHRPVVHSLDHHLVRGSATMLWILFGSAAMLVLVAWANVSTLFLVRGEGRQAELALRRVLGAGRGRVLRLQMAEAFVVAGLAGALACIVAWLGVPPLLEVAPAGVPRLGDAHLGGAVLGFTAGVSVLTALVCGVLPALRTTTAGLEALREASRRTTPRRDLGRDALVMAQTAVAIVLLVGSVLFLRSYQALNNVDPGYDLTDIYTFMVAPANADLVDATSYARFHMELAERITALPEVDAVGVVENLPMVEFVGQPRFVADEDPDDWENAPLIGRTWTGGAYFQAMGIELLSGRSFTEDDHLSTLGNAVVSEAAADLLWPGEEPIGRRLRDERTQAWATVVGVVEDVKQAGLSENPTPLVYYPLVGPTPTSWIISSPGYAVRTTAPERVATQIRELVRLLAPGAPLYQASTMAARASDSLDQLSFVLIALVVASVLTLSLAALGLYAVLSYLVSRRTHEIGVRLALGARQQQVQSMVVAQGGSVLVGGLLVGMVGAMGVSRALESFLFGVDGLDVATFAGVGASMLLVGLLASYLPARRASRVDPMHSLRGD